MDIISRLKKKDLKVWFPLLPGVDGSPEIQCLHLSQSDYDEAIEAATEMRMVEGRRIEQRDEKKFRSLLAQKIVKDWRGIEDGSEAFPCTPENIDYMVQESTEFRLLIMSAPSSFARMLEAEKEELRKNSKPSPGNP